MRWETLSQKGFPRIPNLSNDCSKDPSKNFSTDFFFIFLGLFTNQHKCLLRFLQEFRQGFFNSCWDFSSISRNCPWELQKSWKIPNRNCLKNPSKTFWTMKFLNESQYELLKESKFLAGITGKMQWRIFGKILEEIAGLINARNFQKISGGITADILEECLQYVLQESQDPSCNSIKIHPVFPPWLSPKNIFGLLVEMQALFQLERTGKKKTRN